MTLTVSGLGTLTQPVQASYKSRTVTVCFSPGSLTLAALNAGNSGTTKTNPFTANSSGLRVSYADNGHYDLRLSGGGIATPFTLGDYTLTDQENASLQGLDNVRFADQFGGADLGAKINAADAALGGNAGEIWATSSGTLTTQVNLTSNHTLRFLGNITVTFPPQTGGVPGIQIAAGQSNIGIYCDPGATLYNTQTSYMAGIPYGAHLVIGITPAFLGSGTYGQHAMATMPGSAPAGSTSLTVDSAAGFSVGDDIKINSARYNEWNEVAAGTGGITINLKYPTQYPESANILDFPPGYLTENVTVQGCRFTSSTTAPSASGSGYAIAVYVGKYINILDNTFENIGGRAVLASSGASPTGNVLISGNHARNCGLVPATGGSPCIEVYLGSNNDVVSNNIVEDANSHAYSIHGFGHSVTGNVARGLSMANGCFGFGLGSSEDNSLTGNTVESAYGGFAIFGDTTEGNNEGKALTLSGNTVNNCNTGYEISSNYTRSILIGNYAHRCTTGFYINTTTRDSQLIGNHADSGTTGYSLASAGSSGQMVGNHSHGNTTGYALNSPSSLVFLGNFSDSDTTAFTFGTATYSYFGFNKAIYAGSVYTGTFNDGSSTIVGNTFGGDVLSWSQALAPAPVAANTCAEQVFATAGGNIAPTDFVAINKPTTQAGLGIGGARAAGTANYFAITYCNMTRAPITPKAETYIVRVMR